MGQIITIVEEKSVSWAWVYLGDELMFWIEDATRLDIEKPESIEIVTINLDGATDVARLYPEKAKSLKAFREQAAITHAEYLEYERLAEKFLQK